MTTEAFAVETPSETVSWNVYVPVAAGVKVGLAALVPERLCTAPPVCCHAYVNGTPSGSEDPDPSSVTRVPTLTDCAEPAFASGGWFVVPPPPLLGTPQTSNSARPTLYVVLLTFVMFNCTDVTVFDANVIVVAAPALFNDGTATLDPSENTNVPPVT